MSYQGKSKAHLEFVTVLAMLVTAATSLSGCTKEPAAPPPEPVGEWFAMPSADEAILKQAFMDDVFVIDPGSAQFSKVLKKNSSVTDEVTYCGFVRLKNQVGGYAGQTGFAVSSYNRKTWRLELEVSEFGPELFELSCKGWMEALFAK